MGIWESRGKCNDWYTPKYVFDALGCVFSVDVAAPKMGPLYVPCDSYLSDNSLDTEWNGFVWMNPPFGGRNGLEPWLSKFFQHGNGIALTPDRTSAPWWQSAARLADAHLQIAGKVKFIKGTDGTLGNSPGNGTTLFAMGRDGVEALKRAEDRGLGLLFARMETAA